MAYDFIRVKQLPSSNNALIVLVQSCTVKCEALKETIHFAVSLPIKIYNYCIHIAKHERQSPSGDKTIDSENSLFLTVHTACYRSHRPSSLPCSLSTTTIPLPLSSNPISRTFDSSASACCRISFMELIHDRLNKYSCHMRAILCIVYNLTAFAFANRKPKMKTLRNIQRLL